MHAHTPQWMLYCTYIVAVCVTAAPWSVKVCKCCFRRSSHACSLQTNVSMQAMAINGTIQTIQGLIQVAMMQLVCTYICMCCMFVHAYVCTSTSPADSTCAMCDCTSVARCVSVTVAPPSTLPTSRVTWRPPLRLHKI